MQKTIHKSLSDPITSNRPREFSEYPQRDIPRLFESQGKSQIYNDKKNTSKQFSLTVLEVRSYSSIHIRHILSFGISSIIMNSRPKPKYYCKIIIHFHTKMQWLRTLPSSYCDGIFIMKTAYIRLRIKSNKAMSQLHTINILNQYLKWDLIDFRLN